MKKLYYLLLSVALVAFSASCSDDTTDDGGNGNVLPPKIEAVEGIAENYEVGLHEFLEITPEVKIDNENADALTYEWNINNQKVSEQKTLSYKLNELGEFNAFFKVISEKGAKIVDFKIRVASPYDRGLLLLSETNSGAMLTFKRLDVMEAKASPFAFADNNPTLKLGSKPLSIAWMGSRLTNATTEPENLDVMISSTDPTTVYRMNSNTLQVKDNIIYNGNGTFMPSFISIPLGFENSLWQGIAYFLGNGREYIMTQENEFVEPDDNSALPIDNPDLADFACYVVSDADFPRVYFDKNSHKLLLIGGTMFSAVSTETISGEVFAMAEGKGEVRNDTYEPNNIIVASSEGDNVTIRVFRIDCDWDTFELVDALLNKIDATGHIQKDATIGVDPFRTIIYYAKGNEIYRLNWDGGNFDTEAYIKLPDNFDVKQIVFNQYDENTMYIAAEDKNVTDDFKASLFIYDIKDKTTSKLLFEDHKIGGSVKQMIYKGNAKENEAYLKSHKGLTSLFR